MRLTQAAPAATRTALVAYLRRVHRRGRLSVAYRPSAKYRRPHSHAHAIDAHAVAELMLATPRLFSP
jgi:hypothetical protein